MKPEIKFKAMVDRIEGNKAVLLLGEEEEDSAELPQNFLPEGIREGDIITCKIKINSRRTKEAKEKVEEMIRKLKG